MYHRLELDHDLAHSASLHTRTEQIKLKYCKNCDELKEITNITKQVLREGHRKVNSQVF